MHLLVSWIAYGASPAPGSVDFETMDQGLRSGVHTSQAVVIRNEAAWNRLWIEHKKKGAFDVTPPVMDFSKEMVAAFFLGGTPHGWLFCQCHRNFHF